MKKYISLFAILVLFQSCFGNLFKSSFTSVPKRDDVKKTEGFDESQFQSSLGIKSFDGVFYSYSSLTGIDVSNQAVRDTYNRVKVSLPGANKFNTFNDSIQKSVILLAGSFCDELVDDNTALQNIIGNINLNGDITSSEIDTIASAFVERFFQEGASQEVKDSSIEDYKSLLESLTRSPGSALSKRDYIFSACVATLGSLTAVMN